MKTADFHNDALTSGKSISLLELSRKTVKCVCAVYAGSRTFEEVRKIVALFEREKAAGTFLSLEDAYYLDEGNIEEVCGWSPVCVSLTWNAGNALAGGCLSDDSLSARGKQIVRILAAHGIAVDCAHLNARSFFDVAQETPYLVNSHTCLNAVHRHPRNIDDAQAALLSEYKGLIGITFVGKFLTDGKAKPEDVFRHTDYCVQKFGRDCVCFGTDFFGTEDLPIGLRDYTEEGMGELFSLFVKAGYSLEDIHKIFVGNLSDFLSKNIN